MEINNLIQNKAEKEKWANILKSQKMCRFLSQNGITYEWCIKHPEVLGCRQSQEYYKRFQSYIGNDYCICKNLLIQERKGEKRTFLFVIPSTKEIDLKKEKEILHTSKLEFVSEEKMKSLLQTTPGNVSIFNLLYDQEDQIALILDQEILEKNLIAFHPLYNGMSVFLKPTETLKFLSIFKKNYQIEEIPSKIIEEKQPVKVLKKS